MTTDRERINIDEPALAGMAADREREDKRRWELLGILRGEPFWKECQEAADEMEILMRESEALKATISDMKRDLLAEIEDAKKWRNRHTMTEQELWGQP